MNKIYIDITQLVHWPGRLTGIPRVMNELALRYASNPNVVFVTWDKATTSFYELDIEKSLSQRGQGIFYKTIHTPVNQQAPSRKARLLMYVKKAGHSVKKFYPTLYSKVASKLNRQVLGLQGVVAKPKHSDTLLILWGEWADDTFLEAVEQANRAGVKLAHVVYDMLPIITPQYSGHSSEAMNKYYRVILPLCQLVLSISESTKRDLVTWLEVNQLRVPKIETFRLGDDFNFVSDNAALDNVNETTDSREAYVLCVGTIEARKNHTLLYYVYKLAQSRGISLPKLIIVGRKGWRTDDIYHMMTEDPEVKDKFIFMTSVSDEELAILYTNCLFTVYPSFYEGWGLPIAESIAYGKPCLASNTSSMTEIAGDLIDYFSPLSTEECLVGMQQLTNARYLKTATTRVKRYKTTSWDTTYARVNSLVKEI